MPRILDTNIFNWVIDGRIEPTELTDDYSRIVITDQQLAEINAIKDSDRRLRALLMLVRLTDDVVPAESWVPEASRLDNMRLGDGGIFTKILDALDARNKGKKSNTADALIGEVALVRGYTLVTADGDLAEVVRAEGGHVHLFEAT